MARDNTSIPRLSTAEPAPTDDLEAFFQTPEGQVAKAMLDAIDRGDADEAKRIYEQGQQQYGWTPRSRKTPTPAKPYTPPAVNPPLVLPPEAR